MQTLFMIYGITIICAVLLAARLLITLFLQVLQLVLPHLAPIILLTNDWNEIQRTSCTVSLPILHDLDSSGRHPDLWQYRKACLCTSASMCTSMTSLLPSQTTWPSFSQKPPSIPLCIYVMSTISPMYPLLICYIVPWCQDTSQILKQFSSSDGITIPENYFKIR